MTVFIVGGSGFIGTRLVRLLVEWDQRVVSMDLSPLPASLGDLADRVTAVRGDVTQFDDVMAAMSGAKADRSVNLSYYIDNTLPPHWAMKLNVLGMDNFFEASRLCGVAHAVYASSVGVYGPQRHYGERPVREEDHPLGTGQYAMHKKFNEWQAEDYTEKYGMVITGIRPANVTGPDKTRGSTEHVNCITWPARGAPIVFPYADAAWCPIHVDDVAEMFARVVLADKPRHRIYNSGGTTATIGDIAGIVRELLPKAEISFGKASGGAESTGLSYLVDNSRIVEEFGVQVPPLRSRILQIINEVRLQNGQQPLPG